MKLHHMHFRSGQVALFTAVFFLLVSIVIGSSIASLGVSQLRVANEFLLGKKSFATAESGIEDVMMRMADAQRYSYNPAAELVTLTNQGSASVGIQNSNGAYTLTTTGNVSQRFRQLKAKFTLANQAGLGFPAAITAGYLGVLVSGTQVQIKNANEPTSHGNVYSNGTVDASGGGDLITGDVKVSRPIALDSSYAQQNTDVSGTAQGIRNAAGRRDGAQSFIAPATAYVTEVRLKMSRNATPGTMPSFALYIIPDDPGYDRPKPVNWSISKDEGVPSSAIPYCDTATAQCPDGSIAWTTFRLQALRPVYENEKYWIVVDVSGSGYSNYYSLGSSNSDTAYVPTSQTCVTQTWCNTPLGGAYTPPSAANMGTFKSSADWTASNPTWTPNNVDIGFQIFFGETTYVDQNDPYNLSNSYTTKALGVNAGNDIRASMVDTSVAGGKVYYQNLLGTVTAGGSNCPNANCIGNTPAPDPFSIIATPTGQPWQQYIDTLKQMASNNGTTVINGNVTIPNDVTNYLGAVKINGDLTMNGGSTLIIEGDANPAYLTSYHQQACPFPESGGKCYVVWVTGKLDLNNTCKIQVNDAGANAYIIVTGGKITANNSCQFIGNGGNIFLVDTYYSPLTSLATEPQNTISFANTVTGDVAMFAPLGEVRLANSTNVTALSAAKINVVNSAVITYKDTLADLQSAGADLTKVPLLTAYYESQ